jgi:hypothetical protein
MTGVCGIQLSPSSSLASGRRHRSADKSRSGPPQRVTGALICVTVESWASHSRGHHGQRTRVTAVNPAATNSARTFGYAAQYASATDGLHA